MSGILSEKNSANVFDLRLPRARGFSCELQTVRRVRGHCSRGLLDCEAAARGGGQGQSLSVNGRASSGAGVRSATSHVTCDCLIWVIRILLSQRSALSFWSSSSSHLPPELHQNGEGAVPTGAGTSHNNSPDFLPYLRASRIDARRAQGPSPKGSLHECMARPWPIFCS